MFKKIISLALACLMLLSICGCKSEPDNSSSEAIEVEYQEIIVDEGGETITNSENLTSSGQNVSSAVETTTSSNVSTVTSDNTSNDTNEYIDYDTVVEVDICDDIVRGYLSATDTKNQYHWLSTYSPSNYDHQNLTLKWKMATGPYTVYMSENSDFSNAQTIETKSFEVKNAVCVPGKTYYWKVTGAGSNEILGGGIIKIKDSPVRWIKIDGISNVRDMGGWTTESGKKVKYEMLYRGAQLNAKNSDGTIVQNVKSNGLETFNKLGIKTEFDLRIDTDVGAPAEGTNLNYVFIANHTSYSGVFSKSNKDTVTANYKKIFEVLSDESNYPIYTHCQGGADRTGTYAFLLNGLLGVSYEDLTRDFELTSFAGVKRWRGEGKGGTFTQTDTSYKTETGQTIAWGELYNGMMDYGKENGCTTLSQSIEHWFINYVGVPKSQIDSFKNIMLE